MERQTGKLLVEVESRCAFCWPSYNAEPRGKFCANCKARRYTDTVTALLTWGAMPHAAVLTALDCFRNHIAKSSGVCCAWLCGGQRAAATASWASLLERKKTCPLVATETSKTQRSKVPANLLNRACCNNVAASVLYCY